MIIMTIIIMREDWLFKKLKIKIMLNNWKLELKIIVGII